MIRPGPRNLITDVAGILVGHAEDAAARSGTTVVLPEQPAVAAAKILGGAPGTREIAGLDPTCLVERVHAVVLSGGSGFGLEAAGGVAAWLATLGRGFPVGPARVPIVPSAILFDLLNGGDKAWGETPPYRRLGIEAARAAGPAFALGNAGAGLGAKAGGLKGGLGSASLVYEERGRTVTVGALAAANPVGSVVMPGSGCFWAWALEQADELGGQTPPAAPLAGNALDHPFPAMGEPALPASTTLAVIATDAALTQAQAERVAIMAHDGFARAIRPVHTPLDGDSVFVLATGQAGPVDPVAGLARLGMLAADCAARAIARGVYEARDLGDLRCYRSVHGAGQRAAASERNKGP
jgi:L-aminopeptidase/D-esterase-like protein